MIEETIVLTEDDTSFGEERRPLSINNQSIDVLLRNLSSCGIEINREYSEKKVSYVGRTGEEERRKKVTVPLAMQFSPKTNPRLLGIYLRRNNQKGYLQLEIEERVDNRNSRGAFCISCKILFRGDMPNASLSNAVREALERTYRSGVIAY